jgi:outer membrane protein
MKKIVSIVLVALGLMVAGNKVQAQTKIGYISQNELVAALPEFKKADSAMQDYQSALSQNFEDMKREFNTQDSLLQSKDTARYTRAQLELKRKSLGEMYLKLQGWNQQAQQLLQQKQTDLITPIQKKALDYIQTVGKENGYTWIVAKEALLLYPGADDLMPLVKKKYNLK